MLNNFLKITIRFLAKNKGYTFINIIGLSLGMAAFILLSLFVEKEFSYDEHLSNKRQLYQFYYSHDGSIWSSSTSGPTGALLVDQVPQIESAARFGHIQSGKVLQTDSKSFLASRIYYTDETAVDMFDLETVSGNLTLGFNDFLISEKEAVRLFGSVDQAVGKTVEIVGFKSFIVAGVFSNLPENTHLDFDFLISFENADEVFAKIHNFEGKDGENATDWGVIVAFPLYLKTTSPDVKVEELNEKIIKTLKTYDEQIVSVKLIRVDDIYFSDINSQTFGKGGKKSTVNLYVGIAFVILIMAVINYINLATARFSKRAKEVGIRKTVGSHRWQVSGQFLLESLLLSFTSIIIGICFVEITAPFFSNYLDKTIGIDYQDPMAYVLLIGFTLVIGILAGVYPSMYLSRFNPIEVITGRITQGKAGNGFRKLLVSFQFFICLSLISVTVIFLKQFNHMSNLNMGFDKAQIIGIPLKDKKIQENYNSFKNELIRNPGIIEVSGEGDTNSMFVESIPYRFPGFNDAVNMEFVEPNFLSMIGTKMKLGLGLDEIPESNLSQSILINEAAMKSMNWEDPLGKSVLGKTVVGVVEDFMMGSAKDIIKPLIIRPVESTRNMQYVYIKISGNVGVKETLSYIEKMYDQFSEGYPLEFEFLDETFARKYEKEEKLSQIFSAFTFLAIIISGLGVLGLSIFIAESRIKEIGIRKVLGAKTIQIVWLLNSNITLLIVLVSIVTLPLVYYFMNQWLQGFIFRISISAITLLAPLVLLLLAVWSILIYQSLKTAKVNPVNTLRSE